MRHLPPCPGNEPQSLCQDTTSRSLSSSLPLIPSCTSSCSILYPLWDTWQLYWHIWNTIYRVCCSRLGSSIHPSCTAGAVSCCLRCASDVQPLPNLFEAGDSASFYMLLSVGNCCRRWTVTAHPAVLSIVAHVLRSTHGHMYLQYPTIFMYILCTGLPITRITIMLIPILMIAVLLHSVSLVSSTSVQL